MNLNDEEMAFLKKAAKGSGEKIEQSSIFLSLMSKNYIEDPVCALQLGIAILLDKPIGILVEDGVEVPKGLQRYADGIECYKERGDITEAAGRLMKKLGVV